MLDQTGSYMKLAKKYRTRLTRLADKLEGVGPYLKVGPVSFKKFNLNNFFSGSSINPADCGFVACAVAWASVDPWFRHRKLDQLKDPTFWFGGNSYDNGNKNRTAAWERLFQPWCYPAGGRTRPATVAKRIRKLVEDST